MIGSSFERKRWAPTRKMALGALVLAAATCTVDAHVGYDLPDDVDGGAPDGGACVPGSTTTCYTGPAGTEGVGLCSAGTATCNEDGVGFGPCQGEMTPKPEDCATPVDEDCDGAAPPCTGLPLWSKRFGNDGIQESWRIAADSMGNALITGTFEGTVDFGGGPLASAGVKDLFIAKLDAAGGEHLWSRRFGEATEINIFVAVDGSDNVVIAGRFFGSVDFGGGPLTSADDGALFVAKLDPQGGPVWAKQFNSPANFGETIDGIAVDKVGNVCLVGSFESPIDFGGGLLTSAGGRDLFVVKFDDSGSYLWAKRFGDAAFQFGDSVALDNAGNIALTGRFAGVLDFGGGPLTSTGYNDFFVAKLDATGDHLWSERLGGASPYSTVTMDTAGALYFGGSIDGAVDFGGGLLTSVGGLDAVTARLDAAGNHVYSRIYGDVSDQFVSSIAVDNAGNAILTGYFSGALDFGGGPLASIGTKDIVLAKLDASGTHLWSKRFGDAEWQGGTSLTIDNSGSPLVLGTFNGTVDFGNGPLSSAGKTDIFVAKFSP